MTQTQSKLLTQKQVMAIVPYSHTHIWRLERAGKFPQRLKLGPNRVGWLAEEIEAWVQDKAQLRNGEDQ